MICLDSDCIIDFLKGKKEAIEVVNKYSNEVFTTEINVFEVLFGVYLKKNINQKEKFATKEFFDSIEVFSMESGCGEIASKLLTDLIKSGFVIDQNDCFIASIILNNGCNKIITRNKKHFSKIKGLKIIGY